MRSHVVLALVVCLSACRATVVVPDDGEDVGSCVRDVWCNPRCAYDPDCGGPGCGADGLCRPECAPGTDPDCAPPSCAADGVCDPECDDDPDCDPCRADGACDPSCDDDPDCAGMDCSADGSCNAVCPEGWDPDCDGPSCGADGICDHGCPAGTDPDCSSPDCGADSYCNPECPAGSDPDCSSPDCGADRWCNPECPYGTDPDCGTGVCGGVEEPCCGGSSCDPGLECVGFGDPGDTICLELCTPSVCSYAGGEGTCMDLMGSGGVCMTWEDMTPTACSEGVPGCTTPYGVSVGTTCISDGFDSYCLESCSVGSTGCDPGRICVPFEGVDDLGACVPGY